MKRGLVGHNNPNWRGGMIVKSCLVCSKEFMSYQSLSMIKKGSGKYCSKRCMNNSKNLGWNLRGSNHPKWNGGQTTHQFGYILVKAPPDHPHKTKLGYIREHRFVMEKYLGRYLLSSEDIHHTNGIKTDNRIENLELISSRSEHLRLEHQEGKYREHLIKLNSGYYG